MYFYRELYRKYQPEQSRKASSKRLPATLQLAPLDKLREKRRKKKERDNQPTEEPQVRGIVREIAMITALLFQSREIIFEGIRFPANLNTPSAVAKVLSQEPGQLKASELKSATSNAGTSSAGTSSAGTTSSKQIKEAMFLQKVKEAADHEKSVMLKWLASNYNYQYNHNVNIAVIRVTNLGSLPFTDEERDKVLKDRQTAEISYNV